jgi:histidinol-phosphate phosphatase family protein
MKLSEIQIPENCDNTLFLDRDGVINHLRPNDYVKTWAEFEFLPDVFEALAKWSKQFKHIIVVTNQRGVGKGLMTVQNLNEIHDKMIVETKRHGGRIDKIYYCTALDDTNPNRKPNIGMALQAKQDFPDIDFSRSVMIGDSDSDMEFAKKCKMKGVEV